MLIAHPIPRGSTVVATPALSPPQWPAGTNITIHVDSQYELFNRACATPGIGSAQPQDIEGIIIGSLTFIPEKFKKIRIISSLIYLYVRLFQERTLNKSRI